MITQQQESELDYNHYKSLYKKSLRLWKACKYKGDSKADEHFELSKEYYFKMKEFKTC